MRIFIYLIKLMDNRYRGIDTEIIIDTYMHGLLSTPVFPNCAETAGSNATQGQWAPPAPRSWLLSTPTIEPKFFGEMVDGRTEARKFKMGLEHVVVPESESAQKAKEWMPIKGTQEAAWQISQWPQLEPCEQQNQ